MASPFVIVKPPIGIVAQASVGAPAAKSVVLDQVSELSERLNGDNSIRVAYGGSGVAWPGPISVGG